MTQDEIIEMARQAGIRFRTNVFHSGYCDGVHGDELEAFAKLVAEHVRETEFKPDWNNYEQGRKDGALEEREACARVCEAETDFFDNNEVHYEICAEAIRARGETE